MEKGSDGRKMHERRNEERRTKRGSKRSQEKLIGIEKSSDRDLEVAKEKHYIRDGTKLKERHGREEKRETSLDPEIIWGKERMEDKTNERYINRVKSKEVESSDKKWVKQYSKEPVKREKERSEKTKIISERRKERDHDTERIKESYGTLKLKEGKSKIAYCGSLRSNISERKNEGIKKEKTFIAKTSKSSCDRKKEGTRERREIYGSEKDWFEMEEKRLSKYQEEREERRSYRGSTFSDEGVSKDKGAVGNKNKVRTGKLEFGNNAEYIGDYKMTRTEKERVFLGAKQEIRRSNEIYRKERTLPQEGTYIKDYRGDVGLQNAEVQKQQQSITEEMKNSAIEVQGSDKWNTNEDEVEEVYEDDFEDYSDDFEEYVDDEEDEEMDHKKRGSDVENGNSALAGVIEGFGKEKHIHSSLFNFTAVGDERRVGMGQPSHFRRRNEELYSLVALDLVSFELLDLPPVSAYDTYILAFGRSGTKQVYVQSNEDYVDKEIQTEDVEISDVWTQYPPCRGTCSDDMVSGAVKLAHSGRLAQFLLRASTLMLDILQEECESPAIPLRPPKLSFTTGHVILKSTLQSFQGRPAKLLYTDVVTAHLLLSSHDSLPSITSKQDLHCTSLMTSALLCIWNLRAPSDPICTLFCKSQVTSCCLSPGAVGLVLAGTKIGELLLWDVRQPGWQTGQSEKLKEPQPATFSTGGIALSTGIEHCSPVCAVKPLPTPAGPLPNGMIETCGLSFQVASLDESGLMNLWVVMDLPASDLAGSMEDLGLVPGGKVKLLHSSSLHIHKCGVTQPKLSRFLDLAFLQSEPGHFFVTTDTGLVLRGALYGGRLYHKVYGQVTSIAPVTAWDLQPHPEPLLLVATGDGDMRLHLFSDERPLLRWHEVSRGSTVIAISWSPSRPGLFFTLDKESHLHAWDLNKGTMKTIVLERNPDDWFVAMKAVGGVDVNPGLVLATCSGRLELHFLQEQFGNTVGTRSLLLQMVDMRSRGENDVF
uniref:cytoplasmic dynein 2 intermediate chain 1 n=1 Tax=Myxine glutinosa TaxID=7769 RepID=UPI00358E325E